MYNSRCKTPPDFLRKCKLKVDVKKLACGIGAAQDLSDQLALLQYLDVWFY